MAQGIKQFICQYKEYLPFLLLMATSFFLPTASHRIVFYSLVPFLFIYLYGQRAHIGDVFRTFSFATLCAYLGYFLASLLWSDQVDTEETCKAIRDAACISVFTLALATVLRHSATFDKKKAVLIFAGVVVVFSAALTGWLLLQGKSFSSIRLEGIGRYENPIHFAYLMSVVILLLFSLDPAKSPRERALRYGFVLLCLVFIFLSGTRGALVGIAGCVVLLGIIGRGRMALMLVALIIAAVAVSVVAWKFTEGGYIGRGDNYRFGIWSSAIDEIREKPVIGHGLGTEAGFFPNDRQTEGWKSAHNAFLGHAYTGGIIGVLLYIALIGNMAWQSLRAYWHKKYVLKEDAGFFINASILLTGYYLCVSMFNFNHMLYNMHIHWLVFWVPFAMCWALEVRMKSLGNKAG